jgi:hypothetical protein
MLSRLTTRSGSPPRPVPMTALSWAGAATSRSPGTCVCRRFASHTSARGGRASQGAAPAIPAVCVGRIAGPRAPYECVLMTTWMVS